MADVFHGDIVMLAPKEWHNVEYLTLSRYVFRCDLSLPLSNDPVLNPNRLPRTGIRPARNVASCVNAAMARFQILVHNNASVDSKPSLTRERQRGPYPRSNNFG
jgi:hypothetical protein